jgi:hypothetical protein
MGPSNLFRRISGQLCTLSITRFEVEGGFQELQKAVHSWLRHCRQSRPWIKLEFATQLVNIAYSSYKTLVGVLRQDLGAVICEVRCAFCYCAHSP